MTDEQIHLVTGTSILCGARLTEPWTVNEYRVTCDACRALLLAGNRERRESAKVAIIALTRIIKGT